MWQYSNQLPLWWPPEHLNVSSCIYKLGNRNLLTSFIFWFPSFLVTDAAIILVEDINNYFTTGNDNKRVANYCKIGNPSQRAFLVIYYSVCITFQPQNPMRSSFFFFFFFFALKLINTLWGDKLRLWLYKWLVYYHTFAHCCYHNGEIWCQFLHITHVI